jgi:hypothetical protein
MNNRGRASNGNTIPADRRRMAKLTRFPWRRLRLAAGPCVAALGLALPALAVAGGHLWWWQETTTVAPGGWLANLKPISGVPSVVATGELGDTKKGQTWTVVAYLAKLPFQQDGRELVCVTKILGSLSNHLPAASAACSTACMSRPT